MIETLLQTDDAALDARWERLTGWLRERFARDPNLEAILFLIGVHARGRGFEPKLQKEAKQDLIMEGTCCAFETLGFYERVGMDAEGAWIWEKRLAALPALSIAEQEKLLRIGVLNYFDSVLRDDQPRL